MIRYFLLTLVCVLIVSATTPAQSADSTRQPPKNLAKNTKTAKDPEAERMLKERRDSAQSLLMNLAADVGRSNDQNLRARTQARIADVLWEADQERALTLFRKAWDSAEVADRESQQRVQEEIQQQKAKTANVAVSGPPDLRGEVLRLAARRDRVLGEELLAKFKIEKQQEATDAADKIKPNSFNASEAQTQRLNLARQLLDADVARALQFADPALGSITIDALDFLSWLRERDVAAADRRYLGMLAMAAGTLQSDANTASLLSSYIFTPHLFITFQPNGNTSTRSTSGNIAALEVAPELRAAFFRAATEILLRPMAPPGQDQSSTGIEGKYFVIKRLLPLFDQYAPKEATDAVRAQMEALSTGLSDELRQRDDNSLRQGILPPQSNEDREKVLLDRVDRAKTSEQRDLLYLQLARLFTDSEGSRARDYVDKIADSDLRQKARVYIDGTMIMSAVGKKDPGRVLELVRTGELTHLQKSWALSQAAKFVTKTDGDKALSVLDDATAEARRIEGSDADRPRALMAIANSFLIIDRRKSWEAVGAAIKAANSAEGFTGEDGVIRVSLITKSGSSIRSSSVSDFDVAPIFNELANDDYERAISLARNFEREAPRASATIAIARSVLEAKKN